MNCLLTRFVLWFVTLAVFPIPAKLIPLSFAIEVLQRITFVAPPLAVLPPEEPLTVDLSERVLLHLETIEKKEIDPWLRDDIRIAWITTLYAARGNPQPHVDATYRVLGLHPDKVWPHIVANRLVALGPLYGEFFPAASLRKAPRSAGVEEFKQRDKAA